MPKQARKHVSDTAPPRDRTAGQTHNAGYGKSRDAAAGHLRDKADGRVAGAVHGPAPARDHAAPARSLHEQARTEPRSVKSPQTPALLGAAKPQGAGAATRSSRPKYGRG